MKSQFSVTHRGVPLPSKPIVASSPAGITRLVIPVNKIRPPSLTHRRNHTNDGSNNRLTPTNEQAPLTDRSTANQVFAEYQQLMHKAHHQQDDNLGGIADKVSRLEESVSRLELAQDSLRPMIR